MLHLLVLTKFVVIADPHIDLEYVPYVEQSRENETVFACRADGDYEETDDVAFPQYIFGQYGCDLPNNSFQELMTQIDYKGATATVMLGDIASHKPRKQKYYEQSFEAYGRAMNHDIPNIYVIGNNDIWGKDLGPTFTDDDEDENPILQILLDQLEENGITQLGKKQRKTFLKGAYYEDTLEDLPFLSLNTVMYTEPFLENYKDVSDDPRLQLDWLNTRVKELRDEDVNYTVGMHTCPGVDAHLNSPRLMIEKVYHQRLFEIFAKHRPLAILCGHTHRDQMRALDGIPVLNFPGMSPNTYANPAYRVVQMTKNGLTDYKQHFASVQNANFVGRIRFRFHYGFRELYGHEPVASSIVKIQKEMQKDPKVYATFYEAMDTFYQDKRHNYICATRTLLVDAYAECMDMWGHKEGSKE